MVQIIIFVLVSVFSTSAFSVTGVQPGSISWLGCRDSQDDWIGYTFPSPMSSPYGSYAGLTITRIASGHFYSVNTNVGQVTPCTMAVCISPQFNDPVTGACVDPPPPVCTSGEQVSSGYYDAGTSPSASPVTSACSGSCSVTYSGDDVGWTSLVDGVTHYYYQGSYSKDGLSCPSGGVEAPSTYGGTVSPICTPPQILNIAGDACISDPYPNSVCPSPQLKIGFNADGSPICHTPSTPPATTACPAGQTASNGFCVSNSNTCLATGSCTASDSTGMEPGSYPYVSGSGSTGGTGTANSTTTTNASGVQSTTGCEDGSTSLGCADATIGEATESIGESTIDVSNENFDTFSFTGSGSCPAPRSVSVLGQSFSISYEPACTFMTAFSYIAYAVALFTCGLIMFGAKTEG